MLFSLLLAGLVLVQAQYCPQPYIEVTYPATVTAGQHVYFFSAPSPCLLTLPLALVHPVAELCQAEPELRHHGRLSHDGWHAGEDDHRALQLLQSYLVRRKEARFLSSIISFDYLMCPCCDC
jgi:hypothetical protein